MSPSSRAYNALSASHAIWLKLGEFTDWGKSILETLDLKSDLHLPEVH